METSDTSINSPGALPVAASPTVTRSVATSKKLTRSTTQRYSHHPRSAGTSSYFPVRRPIITRWIQAQSTGASISGCQKAQRLSSIE